jgi:predicted MFS family arabinose efflux permease
VNDLLAGTRPQGVPAPAVEQSARGAGAAPPSARYVWYVIGLLCVVNLFNWMDRMVLAVLAPSVKADLALSDGQLGMIIGFAFAVFYAVSGLPIARWADRGVRRNIIALGLTIWSTMTALHGAAQNFWHLLLARIGVSGGEASSFPAGQSIICDYVPLKRRSGVMSLFVFGLYAGMMTGMALAGWLGEKLGWRWTFVAIGAPGLLLALIVRFTLREPQRGVLDAAPSDPMSLRNAAAFLLECRTYKLLVLYLIMNGFVQHGLNQWWPSFYSRSFELNLSSVGVYLGIALGAGSGAGLLIGGLLSNKLAGKDMRLPLTVSAAGVALGLPTAVATLFYPSSTGSLLFVAVTSLLWNISQGPVIAAIASVVRSQMRATASAINIFLTAVFGMGLGPLFVGLLSDELMLSLGSESLRYALILPISLIPVMAFVLYSSARKFPDDLRRAGARF